MKQSKYSKRRPKDKIAYSQHDMNLAIQSRNYVVEEKKPEKVKYLDRYSVGIFIDDERKLENHLHEMPPCDKWVVLRSYREVVDYLAIADNGFDEMIDDTVFVSFDHYLSRHPIAPTGDDCLVAFDMNRSCFKHIDIRGHSSDTVKNVEKIRRWY